MKLVYSTIYVRAVEATYEGSRTSTGTRMEVVNLCYADNVTTAETKNNGAWVSKQEGLVPSAVPEQQLDV